MRVSPLSIWYKRRRLSPKIIKKLPPGWWELFLCLYLVGGDGGSYRGGVTIYRDEQNCKTERLQDGCLQFWRDDAMAVSIEKLHEIIDLFAQFHTFVRVGYQHTVGGHLNDLCCGLDVGTT